MSLPPKSPPRPAFRGFTLLEMIVALSVLGIIVGMLAVIYTQTDRIIAIASGDRERSQIARVALERISQELAAAHFPVAYHTTQNASATDLVTNASSLALYLRGNCAALAGDGSISGNGLFWQVPLFNHTSNAPTLAGVGYFVRWIEEHDAVRPVLGRLYAPSVTNATNVSALEASTNWVNATLLEELAPMTASTNASSFQGWFADNVLALWVRPLDSQGNAITQYPSLTARGVFNTPVSFDGDFNSLRGYRSGTNDRSDARSLPAMLEVALVVSDSRIWKGNTQRFAVDPALTVNASNYWNSIQSYVDSLPPKIKRNVRVYSTRVAFPNGN